MSKIIFSNMDDKEESNLVANMIVLCSGVTSQVPPIPVVTIIDKKNRSVIIQQVIKLSGLVKLLDSQIDKTKIVPIFATTNQNSITDIWSLKSIKMAF